MREKRKKHDFYPTPDSIIREVLVRLRWRYPKPWEPFNGDGRFSKQITEMLGVDPVVGDITTGQDFFAIKKALAPDIISNPPFKDIRNVIDHAFAIGVERMALVCSPTLFACKKGFDQFYRHRPSRFCHLSWREDYLGKGNPDRTLAVAFWEDPLNTKHTEFEVWEK